MNELPYAEDIKHFWRTSSTSPDAWIEKTGAMIKKAGGRILQVMTALDDERGCFIFMLRFQVAGDIFKILWPVLPSRANNERAARIQAATILYHCVKAKLMEAKVLGMRTAFMPFLALPDGRTASELTTPGILDLFRSGAPQLTAGNEVDGEYREI